MKLYKNLTTASKEREKVEALKINIKSENFPDNLLDFTNLEELYLDGNCKNFPKTPSWKKLKVLSIKWPEFKGDLSTLFTLPNLENLKIIDTPLSTLFLPLGQVNAPLKFLTLKNCGLEKIPEEIAMLEDLIEINLSGNNLKQLPNSFKDMKRLKHLNLDNNQFTKFPDIIKSMPTLTHISIDQNTFSSEEKERIQKEFQIWVN